MPAHARTISMALHHAHAHETLPCGLLARLAARPFKYVPAGSSNITSPSYNIMALLLSSLEALGRRRNVAGPLLLLNLALYVSMLGFASWALNTFVDDIAIAGGDHEKEYYPPAGPSVRQPDSIFFFFGSVCANNIIMTLADDRFFYIYISIYLYTYSTQCV